MKCIPMLLIILGIIITGCTPSQSTFCDNLADPDKEDCLIKLAGSAKDDSICNQIQNKEILIECYHRVALFTTNPAICNKINKIEGFSEYQDVFQDICQIEVAALKKDLSMCTNLKTADPMGKDICYKEVAVAKRSSEICNQIQDEETKQQCLILAAKDVSVCSQMEGDNKDACLITVAGVSRDASICERVTFKDQCYDLVGVTTKNAQMCNKIKDTYVKEVCSTNVAQALNSSLCDELPDHERELCHALNAKEVNTCNDIRNLELVKICLTSVQKS